MRWLPVQQPWVAPDGSHYAYLASDGIYAVSVPSGTQTEVGEGQGWTIVAVQNDGVFAAKQNAAGLWLLPYSGPSRQVTTSGFWQAATSAAAYGTATSAVPQGATNTIIRLDIKTGKTTDWFSRPDAISTVIGFDAGGSPIITAAYFRPGSGTDYWIANDATSAFIIGGSSEFYPSGAPIADPNGVWFSAGSTVILEVAGPALYVMAAIGGQLAGGCY